MNFAVFQQYTLPMIAGGLFTLLGAWVGTRFSAKTQFKGAVLQTFLATRLEAYKDFEATLAQFQPQRAGTEDFSLLYQRINILSLVAGAETVKAMGPVAAMLRTMEVNPDGFDQEAFHQARSRLLFYMHHDLLTYPRPQEVRCERREL